MKSTSIVKKDGIFLALLHTDLVSCPCWDTMSISGGPLATIILIMLMCMRKLEEVIEGLKRDFGTWRVPWRKINRLQRRDLRVEEPFSDDRMSLPVPGE